VVYKAYGRPDALENKKNSVKKEDKKRTMGAYERYLLK
jgi:hypothetical protein